MEFKYLPESMQNIAAMTLKEKILNLEGAWAKEPVLQLARGINEAFITLYSHPENRSKNGNDSTSK
ncbi:hypothetical protein [Citrobacter sp. S-77]|uniref:hypothetical protein n=1 Tax=Citrobacter sp. S-77 TaxID=1080067 RepID=UPI0005EFEB5C|nr:hypothetical protein [Citrobacter sp. S-77]